MKSLIKNKNPVWLFIPSVFLVAYAFWGYFSLRTLFDSSFRFFKVCDISGMRHCWELGESGVLAVLMIFSCLTVLSFVLIFLKKKVFFVWAIFSLITIPIIGAVITYTIVNQPIVSGSIGLGPLVNNDTLAIIALSLLFFIISLVIIIIKSRKLRAKPSK